jgi:hypothetical protein
VSNALAIAAVTAVLRDLLQDGIIDHDITGALGDVSVTAVAPELVPAADDHTLNQINLFMYSVSPNLGWSQSALPSRNGRGERLTNPPLALDLHYLLTVYGAGNFHAEILLGYAMQLLHETPILTRDAIRRALAPPAPVGGGVLPTALQTLSAATLADQVESIRITPHYMDNEQMSNLWSSLQTRYRPSMAYQVSVVLIESERSTRPTLPVQNYNLYAQPFRQPTIEQVLSSRGVSLPILAGDALVLTGTQLRGDDTRVKVGEFEVTPTIANLSDTRIQIQPPAALQAGVQGLQVVQYALIGTPEVPHRGVESNVVAFVLHPVITQDDNTDPNSPYHITVSNSTTANSLASADVEVEFAPPAGQSQRVILLLNEFNPPTDRPPRAYSFIAPTRTADTDTITFAVSGLLPGTYLVRVQIDGAPSSLRQNGAGQFFRPQVTL